MATWKSAQDRTQSLPCRTARCVLVVTLGMTLSTLAGDWPAYKHDAQRSSVTTEALSFPLHLAWEYRCAQPPSPAWPAPFRLLNRTDFDYAPQPVIAQGIVCFGSSADDTVRTLDAKTGQEKWHFITGGPVRLAPQIENGRVYFASDDGFVYCLEADTGRTLWKFQAAPRDERMIGNHRMISRWPVRTSVLVDAGVVYCVAGMWNTEGVFVYALHADTGRIVWCNDTTGFLNVAMVDFPDLNDPKAGGYAGHQGQFSGDGNTPQGPLLLGGNVLLVPNGNAMPRPLDRRTGASITTWERGAVGGGGTWLTIDGEKMYTFFTGHSGSGLGIEPFSLATGEAGRLWRPGVVPQLTIVPPADKQAGQIHERGKVSAIVHKGKLYARKAYGMALAGATLLIGEDGAVVAQDPDTERELWRTKVDGEARAIAVADGRLFVGTSTGMIYCFETGADKKDEGGRMKDEAGSRKPADGSQPQERPPLEGGNPESEIISRLHSAGMDHGFALVLGDAEGTLSMSLAGRTQLRIINALTDEAAAAALREKLLAQTTCYGSRIHVQTVKQLDQLPFAQFFANAVLVAGPAPGLSGKELYRVLHPCGGILLAPGLKPAEAESLLKNSGATEKEVRQSPEGSFIVRGKLPGARDWDSTVSPGGRPPTDQRVKWPLRPLWFGGPSTMQVQYFKQGAAGPLVANGRYFIRGEQSLTAIDAYNGAVLWSRSIPREAPDFCLVDGVIHPVSDPTTKHERKDFSHGLLVNDDSVHLRLGAAYFQGKGDARIQLDARTGEQKTLAGPFNPPTSISLKTPQKWSLEEDPQHAGTIAMESTERGLVLTLTTKDPLVTKLDAWNLFFDFRPPEARYGLFDRGAFQIRIAVARDKNSPASWTTGAGPAHPNLEVAGTRELDGTKTTVVVPWAEIQKLTNGKPSSFGFAVTLDSHEGGQNEPIRRRHLFCDWTAEGLNNGWACVALDGTTVDAAKPPAIIVGSPKDRINGGGVRSGGEIEEAAAETPRIHPLTGEPEPKMYRMASGCGSGYRFGTVLSGGGGLYDLVDDSGLRLVGGVKTGCSTPQVAALGLMLISEETGHCACNHAVRTSLALAPAERRLNEDWALFFDRGVDTHVRQAAINLGAPGDRRDDGGTLWLGYPRLPDNKALMYPKAAGKQSSVGANGVWLRGLSAVLQVPLEVECFGGAEAYRPEQDSATKWGWMTTWIPNRNKKEFGPYRINADRAAVRGTERPWIYASGYRGIRKAVMKLNFLPVLVSHRAEKPPMTNGKSDKSAWQGEPQVRLPFTKTDIFLRHDDANLYLAARRPSVTDRLGKISPWASTTSGDDANVWDDDSFEVFLGNSGGDRVIHLGVAASGARYDALTDGTTDQTEDLKWSAAWTSAVTADESGLVVEMTIPWKTIEAAGVRKDQFGINFQMNQKDISGESLKNPGSPPVSNPKGTVGEALCYLGITGRSHCRNFASLNLGTEPKPAPRPFTVRLHFAELDDVKPGQRIFDVKLQDRVVLKDFDVVKEAGGTHTALVKEFKNIQATEALTIEFVPVSRDLTAATAPILNGLELRDENFKPVPKPPISH